jgi:5-bromo-4-chloroindolyl phosphate hydrolysis protein
MKEIVAGGVGGLVFGVLYLGLNVPLMFAAAGAGAGYLAGRLIMSRSRTGGSAIGFGDDADGSAELIAAAERQVKALKVLTPSVRKPEVREKIQRLTELAEKVVAGVRESPNDAKRVRQFLNYYLGATCTILQRYTELTSRNISSGEIPAALRKVEEMLDSIERVFEQQLAASAQDEVLDLDTELKLLKNTLQLEDLNRAQ